MCSFLIRIIFKSILVKGIQITFLPLSVVNFLVFLVFVGIIRIYLRSYTPGLTVLNDKYVLINF